MIIDCLVPASAAGINSSGVYTTYSPASFSTRTSTQSLVLAPTKGSQFSVKGALGSIVWASTQFVRCGTERLRSAPRFNCAEKDPSLSVSKLSKYLPPRNVFILEAFDGKSAS